MFVPCPKCGKPVSDDSAFCPHCGTAMKEEQPQPQTSTPEVHAAPVEPGLKPDNYLVWSIITTAFCCVPFGVWAIIKANDVDNLWSVGKYEEARAMSEKVRKINLVTMIVMGVFLAFYTVCIVLIGVAGKL